MTPEQYGQEAFMRGDKYDPTYDDDFIKAYTFDEQDLVVSINEWHLGYKMAQLSKVVVDELLETI